MRYLDDVEIGEKRCLGSHVFTAEDIKTFARQFDPQYFHLDEEAAKNSLFGGLCASGWHVASVFMKLISEDLTNKAQQAEERGEAVVQGGPSPGFEGLKWLKPVMAGDEITYFSTPTRARVLSSRPGWSLLNNDIIAYNQNNVVVFTMISKVFIRTSKPM